ncbi:MAG: F0F1 ATP synthase subunit epsilon [Bacteroidota bacterium]
MEHHLHKMNITVLTPDREIFRGAIVSVKVPGTEGQFQVLNRHAPIVSSLEKGVVQLVTAGGDYQYFNEETGNLETGTEAGRKIKYAITGGFIEVLNNEVSLLARGLERQNGNGK